MSRRIVTAAVCALALDLALIVLFAALGRREHTEGNGAAATLRVAAPFLIGWVVGGAAARLYRRPLHPAAAARAWAVALPLGFALRAAGGRGLELSFMVVALLVLGALLIGWRAIWWALRTRPRAARAARALQA
jgi:hypothetical protein